MTSADRSESLLGGRTTTGAFLLLAVAFVCLLWMARADGVLEPVYRDGVVLLSGAVLGLVVGRVIGRREGLYRRRAKRFQCSIVSEVKAGGAPLPVEVCDLSQFGCKLKRGEISSDQTVDAVWLDGHWQRAETKWQNAAFIGVEFSRPLSQRDLLRLLGAGTPTLTQKSGGK